MLPSLFLRYQGMRKLYRQLFLPLLKEYSLTQLEADILLFLANNPEYDTARDIVEKRRLAKSHVSTGVESLVCRGLLVRFYHGRNRKTIHLRLTEATEPIIEMGRSLQRQYAELLFAGFSKEDRSLLSELLERVAKNVTYALYDEEKGSENHV